MLKKIIIKLNKLKLEIIRKFGYLKVSIKLKTKWYGSQYGGFYVCPDLINVNSIVYSFGIGEDTSFDFELIEKHDCFIFGFDPTPKSIHWIRSQSLPINFIFFEYGISHISGSVEFYLPKKSEYVSGSIFTHNELNTTESVSVQMKSINDIVSDLGHTCIDVLKMDIEGSEYDVIDDVLNAPVTIVQILIEFHNRFFEDGKLKTKQVVKKMKKHGFVIFAISANYEEISFVNKQMLKKISV